VAPKPAAGGWPVQAYAERGKALAYNFFRFLNLPHIEEYVLPVLAREKFRTNGIRRAGRLESAVLYLYLHKKNAALVPRLTAIMHQMKTSGQLDQLKMRAREIDNIAANASAPVR
jgi:hypothetical protein